METFKRKDENTIEVTTEVSKEKLLKTWQGRKVVWLEAKKTQLNTKPV